MEGRQLRRVQASRNSARNESYRGCPQLPERSTFLLRHSLSPPAKAGGTRESRHASPSLRTQAGIAQTVIAAEAAIQKPAQSQIVIDPRFRGDDVQKGFRDTLIRGDDVQTGFRDSRLGNDVFLRSSFRDTP